MAVSLGERIAHPAHAGVINPVVVVLDASETLRGRVAAMHDYVAEGFTRAARSSEVFERVVVAVVVINRDRAAPLPLGRSGDPFVPVAQLRLPMAPEGIGVTPLHGAVDLALGMIEREHERLRAAGTLRGVATLIIASDGRPTDADGRRTDAWRNAALRVRKAREDQRVLPAALAFGGADHDTLREFAPKVLIDGDLPALADIISIATMSIDRARSADGEPVYSTEEHILAEFETRYGIS
jgi:uncharacterized protein YegL